MKKNILYSSVAPAQAKTGIIDGGAIVKVVSDFDYEIRYYGVILMDDRDLYSGLIRLHILHHACHEPIFGAAISEELARHGYRMSPGTLYPVLHGLERKGYLRSSEEREGRRSRRVYRATPAGRKALKTAKVKVRELFAELFEDD